MAALLPSPSSLVRSSHHSTSSSFLTLPPYPPTSSATVAPPLSRSPSFPSGPVSSRIPSDSITADSRQKESVAASLPPLPLIRTFFSLRSFASSALPRRRLRQEVEEQPTLQEALEDAYDQMEFLDLQLESSIATDARHYEVMFLISQLHLEEKADVLRKVQDYVSSVKGEVTRLNDWGVRKLAYKIRKCTHANYILLNVAMRAEDIGKLEKMLLADERVVRHLVMKQKSAPVKKEYPPPPYYQERTDAEFEGELEEDEEEEEDEEDEEEGEEERDDEEGQVDGGEEVEQQLLGKQQRVFSGVQGSVQIKL